MRNVKFGIRNLDSPSPIFRLKDGAFLMSVLQKREPRRCPGESRELFYRLGPGFHRGPWIPASAGMRSLRATGFIQQSTNLILKKIRNPQLAVRNYLKVLLILCAVSLVGCGYQMVGRETHVPPGLTSIAIPTFENKTFEPGIEIPFTQALLREFIQDRRVKVVDRAQADSILEGVVRSFYAYGVSFDSAGLVVEYQTSVVLDLTLKDRTGKVLWEEKGFSESRWYRAASQGLTSEANKQAAIQETGRFVAQRLRSRFFYNF